MVMATTRTDDGGDDPDRCLHSFRPSKGSSIYKVDSALLSCLHNVHGHDGDDHDAHNHVGCNDFDLPAHNDIIKLRGENA